MKTRQIFITLISSALFFACTTDDSILNDKKNDQTLESLNSFQLSLIEVQESQNNEEPISNGSNLDLSEFCSKFPYDPYIIHYPSSPYWFLSDYKYARIYRTILETETIPSGCLRYNFPNIPKVKYRKGVYSEKIELIIELEPGGILDDIEL